MAPVGVQVSSWAVAGSPSPEFILASLLFLFALATLLAVCSQCSRHSFELKNSCEMERSPSVLIWVTHLEGSPMTIEDPGVNGITKDEQGDLSNHKVNSATTDAVSEPPALTFPRITTPSGAAVTSPQQEDMTLQSALTKMSPHPPGVPMTNPRPLGQSGLWEHSCVGGGDGDGDLESSPDSLADRHQQQIQAHHTYESLEELEEAESEESPAYQTVAEFNAPLIPPPHLPDLQQDLLTPATADEWPPLTGRGLTAMYAQVSKKNKILSQPSKAPPDGEESVPQPHPLLEEEEEPAPPIPGRSFEVDNSLSTAQHE